MNHKDINRIIEIVEQNLLENFSLNEYARLTGYSKFHLIRSFKAATGYTLYEYIAQRRIALAAEYLLYSDITLIDLAITLNFQSQEAFTRRFKEIYGMPPGKYRRLIGALMEEEAILMNSEIKGWIVSGTTPHLYKITTDKKVFHKGKQSALIHGTGGDKDYNDNTFGTIMQSISAEQYIGKRIRFSAFIKTEEAGKVGLWARIDDQKSDILQFDNMMERAITGTTHWNHYSVVLEVTEAAESIHFGVLLVGQGKVWIDQFSVEEVDNSVPSTDTLKNKDSLPKVPVNLEFEEVQQ
ncbi:helix-turn-helix domain-containing protein [Macrococcus equipercicus]|uniref:Helix-turn-helix transcriptional regulator n=1 Tax=Macrococcus equipercicus TaxID=69967 RepID=A0A9Q9BVF7_9STAP|nr:AraC family transcriptional regulator [Macrococcus equipercicus]UTH13877.1 helix-turn-helix transcriptional regulator [Macrococcus equipercicus]